MVVVDEGKHARRAAMQPSAQGDPPHAHVLFVGDADQLPSVGPGNVLHDLIESWAVPAVHLDLIFRQAEGSGIIANAHRINQGEPPQTEALDDFFFFPRPQPEACAEMVVDLVADRIARRFGYRPPCDSSAFTDASWSRRCSGAQQSVARSTQSRRTRTRRAYLGRYNLSRRRSGDASA